MSISGCVARRWNGGLVDMKKRMFVTLAATALFLGAIGSVKVAQVRAAMAQSSFTPPPEAVTTTVAKQESWPASLNAIGTVTAIHGVTVSADQPGIVNTIEFESGRKVVAGAVLVRLDTKQEQAQLAAAEAQRELTRLNLERARDLKDKKVLAQSEFDRSAAEAQQAEARVAEIRATIARKTIRAPFGGVLGIRQVNVGQYLAAGAPVVPLQSLDPIYVDFTVPQQDVAALSSGVEVRASLEGSAGQSVGKLSAVDSVIDAATRNVHAQATFGNPDGRLHPGMFVKAQVKLAAAAPIVSLPASAVSYAPYGDSVFVVKELTDPRGKTYRGVTQQFVKLGAGRGDQISVVSGLAPGSEVVTSGVFKLRNGAAVLVDNKVMPGNSASPKPEDS
jgi:membrane fusion protein (multidrug efflux system)